MTKPNPASGMASRPDGECASLMDRGRDMWTTRELFGERNEIGIDHAGTQYRLKITRQGKLILNK